MKVHLLKKHANAHDRNGEVIAAFSERQYIEKTMRYIMDGPPHGNASGLSIESCEFEVNVYMPHVNAGRLATYVLMNDQGKVINIKVFSILDKPPVQDVFEEKPGKLEGAKEYWGVVWVKSVAEAIEKVDDFRKKQQKE